MCAACSQILLVLARPLHTPSRRRTYTHLRIQQRKSTHTCSHKNTHTPPAEMEGDDLVGDTWMEDTIGQDIVATAIAPSFVSTTPAGVMESLSPDKMVFVRRENVGFGSSSRSRGGGSKLLVWRGVGAAGGGDGMGLHDKEQLGTSTFSVAMQEIELEAWRETANTIPFPLSAAYEAAYREQLRQKGSNLIERMERLRTLLDTSLVRFFDPSTMAADKFSFVDDIASLSLDLSEVESEEFHSEDWEDIESVEEMRAKEAS